MAKQILIVDLKREYLDKCSLFDCGNPYINGFLNSANALNPDVCHTYLLIGIEDQNDMRNNNFEIIGFFSLTTDVVTTLERENVVFSGGAIRIKMFAIDNKYKKKKINVSGEQITYASVQLKICLDIIESISNKYIGATYIVLNSTEEGKNLYLNKGAFEILDEDDDYKVATIEEDTDCFPMYRQIRDEDYYWYEKAGKTSIK